MADDPVIGDSSDNEPGIPRWWDARLRMARALSAMIPTLRAGTMMLDHQN